jgi:hypothetical protein
MNRAILGNKGILLEILCDKDVGADESILCLGREDPRTLGRGRGVGGLRRGLELRTFCRLQG